MNTNEKLYHVFLEVNDVWESIVVKATSLRNAFDVFQKNFRDISDAFRYIVDDDGKNLVFTIDEENTNETQLCARTSFNARFLYEDRMEVVIEELKIPAGKVGYSLGYVE